MIEMALYLKGLFVQMFHQKEFEKKVYVDIIDDIKNIV